MNPFPTIHTTTEGLFYIQDDVLRTEPTPTLEQAIDWWMQSFGPVTQTTPWFEKSLNYLKSHLYDKPTTNI